MIGFHLVIADSEQDMPGIKPGPLGWNTSTLTNEIQAMAGLCQTVDLLLATELRLWVEIRYTIGIGYLYCSTL